MSNKITVRTTPKNRIMINNRTGGVGSVDTLVQLKDVDATHLTNNETVVYDEASGKFKIETLPIVDGGLF